MSWESRGGTAKYYTRSRRVDGRMVREYFGIGPEAEAAAQEDNRRRLKLRQARQEQALRRQRRAVLEQLIDEYDRLVDVVLRVEMAARGYHYHRGGWRRHRASKLRRIAAEQARQQQQQEAELAAAAISGGGTSPQEAAAKPIEDAPRRRPMGSEPPRACGPGLVRHEGFRQFCTRLPVPPLHERCCLGPSDRTAGGSGDASATHTAAASAPPPQVCVTGSEIARFAKPPP